MSNSAKVECLSAAIAAIAACLKDGRVTNEALAPIAAAIALGIAPPFVRPGSRPFAVEGVKAAPGTWPHFAKSLINIEAQQLDLNKLRELTKAGDQSAERRGNFMNHVLTAVHGAFVSALRRLEELEQAEVRREREAKERQETEEQRKAREARRAARNALEAAAAGNAAPVEQAKPRDRRRTPEGVTRLIVSETAKWVAKGDDASEAKLSACRFVFRLVHDDAKSGAYTATEVVSLKDAIKAEVQIVYFRASSKLTEAEREATAWMQRGEEVMARKDREEEAARKAASNPPAAKTPAAEAPKPAAKPAPTKAVKPAKEPAKPVTLPADAPKADTVMGLALQKALTGKAANG